MLIYMKRAGYKVKFETLFEDPVLLGFWYGTSPFSRPSKLCFLTEHILKI